MSGIDQEAEIIAVLLQSAFREACPKNSRKLAKSIKVIAKPGGVLEVWMDEIWKYIEFGTNPHIIQPANKKALAFEIDGEMIFAKKVDHPGTRPNPFIRNVLNTQLPRIIKQVMNR